MYIYIYMYTYIHVYICIYILDTKEMVGSGPRGILQQNSSQQYNITDFVPYGMKW